MPDSYDKKTIATLARTPDVLKHDAAVLAFLSDQIDELYGDMDFVESDLEHRNGRGR